MTAARPALVACTAETRRASPSPGAQRLRRYHARQRKGLVCLDGVEWPEHRLIVRLVEQGFLSIDDAADRKAVERAATAWVASQLR